MAHNGSARDEYVSLEEATALASVYLNAQNLQVVGSLVEPFASEKLGYLADHKLLSIKVHRQDHLEETCSFFVKALPPNCDDFQRLAFQEERQFFGDALPRLLDKFSAEPWAAKCYLVKDELLVLEDLSAQGFKHAGQSFTANQLRTAVASVARFHACSMMLQAKLPDRRTLPEVFPGLFKEKTFINDDGSLPAKWLATGLEVTQSVARDLSLDPKHASVAFHAMLQQMQPLDACSPDNVLAHRDLWSNNIMFSDDEQSCRLLDFQMLAFTSLAIDVLQLLYLNADVSTRRALEPQLVQHYHTALKSTLVDHGIEADDVLSLEQVSRAIEKKRVCGLVMAVLFGPIMLLNKQFKKQMLANYQYYTYICRKDLVNKAMEADQHYRDRVQESVRELVDYMEHFQHT